MKIMRHRWIWNLDWRSTRWHHRTGGLHEKKRRFAFWIFAHLARMGGVVATNTKDTINRKAIFAVTSHSKGINRGERNDVGHAISSKVNIIYVQCRFGHSRASRHKPSAC